MMNNFPYYGDVQQGQNNFLVRPTGYQITSTPYYYANNSYNVPNHTQFYNPYSDQGQNQETTPPKSKRKMSQPVRNVERLDDDDDKFSQLLKKIDSDIESNNQLFREEFAKILRQRTTVIEKLKDIKDIKDYKAKVETFEKLAQLKPTFQDALVLRNQIHGASDPREFTDISLIAKDIEDCEILTRKLKDFFIKYTPKVKNHLSGNSPSKEYGDITRSFCALKNEIDSMILKDTDVLEQWGTFEWFYRVKLELLKQAGPLRHCTFEQWNELKNLAFKYQGSEISESKQFEMICEQIDLYTVIKNKIELIKKQETSLLQQDINKNEIAEIRKKLFKKTDVEDLLKSLQECRIKTTQEELYLEGLLERVNTAIHLYTQRKLKQKRLTLPQLEQFRRSFEKLPMQTTEEPEIATQRQKGKKIVQTIQINRARLEPTVELTFAKVIYEQYKNCFVDYKEAAKISAFYVENHRRFPHLEEAPLVQHENISPNIPEDPLLGKRKEPFSSGGGEKYSRENSKSKASTASKSDENSSFTMEPALLRVDSKTSETMTSLLRTDSNTLRVPEPPFLRVDSSSRFSSVPPEPTLQRILSRSSDQETVRSEKSRDDKFNEEQYIYGTKKLKTDYNPVMAAQVNNNNPLPLPPAPIQNEIKVVVSEYRREKARTDIAKTIYLLKGLPSDKDKDVIAKNLEEKVYNRYLNNREQFLVRVESICKFFKDLNDSQQIREKLFATSMEYDQIRGYLDQPLEKDPPKILSLSRNTYELNNTVNSTSTAPVQSENVTMQIENSSSINAIMNFPDYLSKPLPTIATNFKIPLTEKQIINH